MFRIIKTQLIEIHILWIALVIILLLSECSKPYCPKKDEPVPVNSSSSEIVSWSEKNSSITSTLLSDFFINDTVGYICGVGGLIYKTSDGINSLTLLNSGTSQNLYSIWFIDSDTGIAVGDGNTILRTIDAGVTWNTVSSPVSANFRKIFFLDSNTGFIVGGHGSALKTTNGGITWNALNTGTFVDLHGVFFTDFNTGFISAQSYSIYKTIDGGVTWSSIDLGIPSSASFVLASIYFTDSNNGYAVGGLDSPVGTGNNLILRTSDGGNTWVEQSNPVITDMLLSVRFEDSKIGYIATADIINNVGHILKTDDGGVSWTVQATSVQKLYCMTLSRSGIGYAVGFNGEFLKGNL